MLRKERQEETNMFVLALKMFSLGLQTRLASNTRTEVL
jgi:hypothetical protein